MIPIIGDLINTTANSLDKLFTNDEERLEAQSKLKKLEVDLEKSMNDHMNKVVDAQKSIMTLEYEKGSWIARNWRPLLMVVFILMISYNYLFLPIIHFVQVTFDCNFWMPDNIDIPDKVWTLLQIGLGGYIVGRSGEKIADKLRKK